MTEQQPAAAGGKPAPAATRAPADVLRVVLAYAVFASLWILLSDTVVGWLFSDPAQIVQASTIKGWLFVVVTSMMLYGLIRRLRDQALAGVRRELAAQHEKAHALQLLSAITDNSSDAIYAKDLQGRYLVFNREVGRIVGKSADELRGQDDTALFPLQAETIRANDRRVMLEDRTATYEETMATAEGERIFLTTKGILHDAQGQLSGIFGISRDITDSKRAQAALLEREARLNFLLTHTPTVIYTSRVSGDFGATFVSGNIQSLLGYQASEYIDDSTFWVDHIHPEDRARVIAGMAQLFTQGHLDYEYRFRHQDGSYRWMRDQVTLLRDDAEQPIETIGAWTDITESKQAQAALLDAVEQRARETAAALEAQQQGRFAALNLMDDAVAARQQAEAMSTALKEQLGELQRWQQAMLGREGRIMELKKEVNSALAGSGQPPRYKNIGHVEAET